MLRPVVHKFQELAVALQSMANKMKKIYCQIVLLEINDDVICKYKFDILGMLFNIVKNAALWLTSTPVPSAFAFTRKWLAKRNTETSKALIWRLMFRSDVII
ncbi:MAG: hypothetical protein IMY76_06870 [Chloroflexi bacterium]|nr:hypothetical protein [Chloroflexota bacterium]